MVGAWPHLIFSCLPSTRSRCVALVLITFVHILILVDQQTASRCVHYHHHHHHCTHLNPTCNRWHYMRFAGQRGRDGLEVMHWNAMEWNTLQDIGGYLQHYALYAHTLVCEEE